MLLELISEQKMYEPSVEDMWIFIDEVLPRYGDIIDKNEINYEQVCKLFSIVKKSYHMFQILAQTTVLKQCANKLHLLKK